ncbi:response regulator [Spirosoma endophyticum]|uniref:Response regulatory domain-containing protein n=1 Tax=Spirosoma endophyticum TaxID=662367 RepID=A0A1I2EWI4_9BACT|nr:response regulator [Spirosoma endophyticum]SFE97474.1 hypothetical protein SAMN05216167_12388 [Spirosoma endophyticum]
MSPTTKPSTGGVILVVDDNRDAAYTLAMLLQLNGYETHACYSGQ